MKLITRKLHFSQLGLIFFLVLGLHTVATAQEEVKESKKVTIITKKIDKNGKEVVEKRVIEGDDMSDAEIDQIIEDAKKAAKEIDVRIEKEEMRTIKSKSKDKSQNIWIEQDGEKINLDEMDGEKIMIFKTKDGEIMELDGDELHEEHVIIKKGAGKGGKEEMEIEVTVDENGDTQIVEKKGNQQKKTMSNENMEVTVSIDQEGKTKIIKKRIQKESVDYEAKLEKMGIKLPVLGEPVANYVHAVTSNNWVFLAGKGPRTDEGKNIVGKLGKDLTVEQGYEAAKWAGINLLAALKGEIGDFNRVVRIVKVKGMVNATPEFTDHSKVINGFSDLMVAVFGDKGKHARAAVGMNSLPGNMAVEIEVVVEIE